MKQFYFKLKASVALGVLSSLVFSTAEAQTVARPWFEGFSAATTVPVSLTATGYWQTGEDASFPGNPGGVLVTAHWPSMGVAASSSLVTPNVTGILATDSFSFDYKHNTGFPVPGISSNGATYFKVFISTNNGTSYTQIDSIGSTAINAYQSKKYALATYVGQSVRFKLESYGVVTSALQSLSLDNFRVDGAVTPTCTLPVVGLGSDTLVCDGQSLMLDAQNSGATYLWSDGSTNQTLSVTNAGTYWVTVTNAPNCSASDTIMVTTGSTPTGTYNNVSVTGTASNFQFTFDSPEPGVNYTWNFCDGTSAVGSSVTYNYTSSAACSIELSASNDCGTTVMSGTFTPVPTNVQSIVDNASLSVFPNPATNMISLEAQGEISILSVDVLDILGRKFAEKNTFGEKNFSLDCSGYPNGGYFLKILTNHGVVHKTINIVR